ncbi:hypothetical protein [Adonisia turfae]|nr:hypothetical protein [Adonisia turfae]
MESTDGIYGVVLCQGKWIAGLVPTLGREATAKQGNHKGLPLRILLFF